jgi:hypothetical protein
MRQEYFDMSLEYFSGSSRDANRGAGRLIVGEHCYIAPILRFRNASTPLQPSHRLPFHGRDQED